MEENENEKKELDVTLTLENTLTGHKGVVWCVAWSPGGNLLASCGEDKTIRLWGREGSNLKSWVCKAILKEGHKRTIRKVSWSPTGTHLISSSFDATTSIWENKNGEYECVATLEGHETEVKDAKFDKTGTLIATCSRDKSVWIWEMDALKNEFECVAVLHGHTQDVKSIIWHPTKELVVSTSYDDTIKFWMDDGDDWECVCTLKGHQSTVWGSSFSPTGDRLVSCSDDKTIIVWRKLTKDEDNKQDEFDQKWVIDYTITGYHIRCVYSVDWSKKGNFIATASGDNCIRIFKVSDVNNNNNNDSYELVTRVESAHKGDVNCVVWNGAESTLLASCSDDGSVKIWKLGKREQQHVKMEA